MAVWVLGSNSRLMMTLAFAVLLSMASAESDSFEQSKRLRLQRDVCIGPPSQVNYVCRWSGLECPCVNGTYCSTTSHTCEVCQTTTAECTSPCRYPCLNGGRCVWRTGVCECPAGYWGVDCSSERDTPQPVPSEVTVTRAPIPVPDPDPDVTPSPCRGQPCLNGGRCEDGRCVCPFGYYLPDCSLCLPRLQPLKCRDHCGVECANGDCLTVEKRCHCSVGYTGEDCNLCVPSEAYLNCTNFCYPACANDATCNVATRKCECARGWTGEACDRPCLPGTHGPNCRQRCQCPVGSCDPVTGNCLCGTESPGSPECADPTGNIPDRLLPTRRTLLPTTAAQVLGKANQTPLEKGRSSMMTLVVATAAGASFLLIVVVILIVCLVRTKRQRKRGRSEEAERVPMTDTVTGNAYDDASSLPVPPAQSSSAPYRPTSGYEDVAELHQNMPDLLHEHPAEANDISPYATTGNVTVHAESGPSEYSYASVDELKVLKGQGEAAAAGEAYDRLDFLPRERSLRRPVVADGTYGSLRDDGSYEDASSYPLNGAPLGDHRQGTHREVAEVSGYAEMTPSPLVSRKASSLKSPRKELLSADAQRKAASLKRPKAAETASQQTCGNGYVGFDPKRASQDAGGSPRMAVPPPPPPDLSSRFARESETNRPSAGKPKSEIPQYAKPMKRKSQQGADRLREIPHYAKPDKPKSTAAPEFAKPNKGPSSGVRLERPLEGSQVRGKMAADYAHLMHAVSPEAENHVNSK